MAHKVSELFDEQIWQEVAGFQDLEDVTYHRHVSLGIVRVAFNRPEVRNAFRPKTVDELWRYKPVGCATCEAARYCAGSCPDHRLNARRNARASEYPTASATWAMVKVVWTNRSRARSKRVSSRSAR